jgi:hypothetical protein
MKYTVKKWGKLEGRVNPQNYDLGGILGSTFGGVATGASVGGPVGAIVGGGLGLIKGLLGNKKEKEEKKQQEQLQAQQILAMKQANMLSMPQSGGGMPVNPFSAYGGYITPDLLNEFKKGGWIQKAVNPAHKGYCTPMTKSTCTPRRKAFAMTMKKHHGFHKAEDGVMIPYTKGGYVDDTDSMIFAKNGGLSRASDYGSSKKPYPSVNKSDFAGGGRSYPIPTKADAVDALRLAGLHGRADVKAKVYSKYPELKKAMGGMLEGFEGDPTDPTTWTPKNSANIKDINSLSTAYLEEIKGKYKNPYYLSDVNINKKDYGDKRIVLNPGKKYALVVNSDSPFNIGDTQYEKGFHRIEYAPDKSQSLYISGKGNKKINLYGALHNIGDPIPEQKAKGGFINPASTEYNSITNYMAGGTHEVNPLGGIPIGNSMKGKQNTVEQGETSYKFKNKKYVFSNRLRV